MGSLYVGKKALLVEDEAGIRAMCIRVLQGDGCEVDVAENGVEAREKLANNYDLVLLDFRIPLFNGQQILEYIGSVRPELKQSVVFMTGEIGEDVQRFFRDSGRPVLAKPFTPSELRSIVQENLSK